MALIIDGYNLLHATDIFGPGGGEDSGASAFRRSREALLEFLAASLDEKLRAQTSIVFDAAEAPPGLPSTYLLQGVTVIFARDYPDADTLIEELIADHHAPRGLLVVSSDHRVQRAARRRGAKYTDSEQWYADLWQRRVEMRRTLQQAIPEKPIGELSAAEVAYWIGQFDSKDLPEVSPPQPSKGSNNADQPPATFDNPFPEGYGDDLLRDENI